MIRGTDEFDGEETMLLNQRSMKCLSRATGTPSLPVVRFGLFTLLLMIAVSAASYASVAEVDVSWPDIVKGEPSPPGKSKQFAVKGPCLIILRTWYEPYQGEKGRYLSSDQCVSMKPSGL